MRFPPTALAPFLFWAGSLAGCSDSTVLADDEREDPPITAAPRVGPRPPELRLNSRRQRALPAKPEWVTAGDIDGDGYEELLATTLSPGSLHVFRGDAKGLSEKSTDLLVGGYPLRPILIPDPAGEGQQVVVAERASSWIRWLRPFAASGEQILGSVQLGSVPRAIGGGDLGADGQSDLVLALDGPRLVRVTPSGVQQDLPLVADLPRCLVVGEDCVFVGSQSQRRVDRYLWSAGQLLESPTSFPLPGIPRDMILDDVDQDGDLELLVAGGSNEIWVLGWGLPGGPTALEPDTAQQAMLSWKQNSVPIDLGLRRSPPSVDGPNNAPTSAERMVLCFSSMAYVRYWDLTPEGPRSHDSGYAGQTPTSATFLHLNADGFLDMAVANRDSNAISLLRGKDAHTFHQPTPVKVGGFPNALAQGDLNADGWPDLLVVNSKQDSLTILLGSAKGLIRAEDLSVDRGPHAPRLQDFDGDGNLDCGLLCSDATGCTWRRLFGDGTGTLAPRENAPPQPVGKGMGEWLMCDVTGDGAQEVLILSPELERLTVFAPPGADPLRYLHTQPLTGGPRTFTSLAGAPGSAALLAIGLTRGKQKGVVIGTLAPQGPGEPIEWSVQHDIPLTVTPTRLRTADMDGNGLEDVVVLSLLVDGGSDGRVVPLMQVDVDGAKQFTHWIRLRTSSMPRDMDLADLNGDGLPEILVCAQYAHIVDLWEGRTNLRGQYSLRRRDGIGSGVGAMAATVLDLNHQGLPDVVIADGHADQISSILNDTGSAD